MTIRQQSHILTTYKQVSLDLVIINISGLVHAKSCVLRHDEFEAHGKCLKRFFDFGGPDAPTSIELVAAY